MLRASSGEFSDDELFRAERFKGEKQLIIRWCYEYCYRVFIGAVEQYQYRMSMGGSPNVDMKLVLKRVRAPKGMGGETRGETQVKHGEGMSIHLKRIGDNK